MKTKLASIWSLHQAEHGRSFLYAVIVGVTAGLAAIAFHTLVDFVQYVALESIAGYRPAQPAGEHSIFPVGHNPLDIGRLLLVITGGGLITGLLIYRFAPETKGQGTDGAIDAFHNHRGIIPLRIPILKGITAAVTLGTGGSAGREGPIAQIGAGVGSYLATRMRLSARDRRLLLAMGMGAGIGAMFRAPMAGTIFAGEIMYRDPDIEAGVIVPGAIAST
ncbi:MAG: chloride channel protein, partial [Planctomycetota bacterium]